MLDEFNKCDDIREFNKLLEKYRSHILFVQMKNHIFCKTPEIFQSLHGRLPDAIEVAEIIQRLFSEYDFKNTKGWSKVFIGYRDLLDKMCIDKFGCDYATLKELFI